MAEPPEKKEKVCHSCGLDDQGQSTLLDADGAAAAFAALPENLWTLEEKRLTRKFTAKNFLQAVAFVNAVAPVAEDARHHPDIHITNYREVELVLFTHSQVGLTPDDFALASKLSRIGVAVSPKWAKEHPEREVVGRQAALRVREEHELHFPVVRDMNVGVVPRGLGDGRDGVDERDGLQKVLGRELPRQARVLEGPEVFR